ncbi:MAG TPA: hypothetical protein VH599_07230 [Ktedonobacterales bacterium]
MPFVSHSYLEYLPAADRTSFRRRHLKLGDHPETRDELLIPDGDRYAGTYVLGVQGVGKSGLLENLIAQDAAAGRAAIVIDPHGDLTKNCIAQLPSACLERAYLLDMEDEEAPFGVNVFAHAKLTTSLAQAQAVDRLMHIFEVLWPEVLSQQNLPRYVRAATLVLLANPGATLVDMHTFLLDEHFRARLLAQVTDSTIKQFWATQYDNLSDTEQNRRVQPLINRLEALFLGRTLVRNIVGQSKTTVNWRKAIEGREIVFVRLPVKTLTQDARLLGTVIIAQLHAALFSFADIPEAQRPGFSLYVDEFQHFATPDFAELFTEGRKFSIRTHVAHQYRGQLPEFLQQSTMTARTKICFQTTPEDGREMAHVYPSQETTIKPEDIDPHVTETLLMRASDYGIVAECFVDGFLQPLQRYRRGRGKTEIVNPGFDLRRTIIDIQSSGETVGQAIIVDDPTYFLDRLLYDVMRTGNWLLPIPYEIPRGFANSGKGFFAAARGAKDWELGPEMMDRFPAHLVVRTAEGDQRWTREPENGKETFYFFLYCLRSLMNQLAEEPIGKETRTKPADIAQMLSNLPKRAAFVRSGEDIGVIYTSATPAPVGPAEAGTRLQTIRQQTRAKYCHPREDVEQALLHDEVLPISHGEGVPISRWEQV